LILVKRNKQKLFPKGRKKVDYICSKGSKEFPLEEKRRKSPYSQFASPANQELFEHQRSQEEPSSVSNMINIIKWHLFLL